MSGRLDARVTVSPDVMLQENEGEAVLLDLKGESCFGLDAVGTRAWRLIEEHGNVRAVYEAMLREFDVQPAQLEHDLDVLIGELASAGLVIVEGAAT
jgi:hypothetical protein